MTMSAHLQALLVSMTLATVATAASASVFLEQSNRLSAWITADDDVNSETRSALTTNYRPGSFTDRWQFDSRVGSADVTQSLMLSESLSMGSTFVSATGSTAVSTGPAEDEPESPFVWHQAASDNTFSTTFQLNDPLTVHIRFDSEFAAEGEAFARLQDEHENELWWADNWTPGLPRSESARVSLDAGTYTLNGGAVLGLHGPGAISGDFDLSMTVVPELAGDMNLDGVVDTADVAALVLALTDPAAYMAQYGVDEATMIALGDINQDGAFDTADVAPFVQLLVSGDTSVPEPGSMALLALGALVLLRRRRTAAGR